MYLVCWMVCNGRVTRTHQLLVQGWSPKKGIEGLPAGSRVGGGSARERRAPRSEPQVEAMETAFPADSEKRWERKLGKAPEVWGWWSYCGQPAPSPFQSGSPCRDGGCGNSHLRLVQCAHWSTRVQYWLYFPCNLFFYQSFNIFFSGSLL